MSGSGIEIQRCSVAGYEDGGRGHNPRNTGGLGDGKCKEVDSSFKPPGVQACQ